MGCCMRTYEVSLANEKLTVIMVVDGKATSTIIVPMADQEVVERALEDLFEYAYLDGKLDARHPKPSRNKPSGQD